MFIQKCYIDKLIVCHLCNERYSDEKQPLLLPCGQTVCSKCVTAIEFNELTFKCISCQNDHLNPIDVFPVNKMAKDLSSIEAKDVSRSKECESLKNNLNQLDSFFNDLNEKIKLERNKFKEQCQELKHKATQKANQRVQEINNNLQECLNRIDEYEREYDLMFATEIEQTTSSTQVFLDENKNYLTQYEVDDAKIVTSNEKLNEFKFELEARLESSKLENNRIEFEINENELESDILGCLIRKNKEMPYSTVISCSDDLSIKVFSLESGKQLKTYRGHLAEVTCIKVILNSNINGETESKYIASGSNDKTIKIWEIKSSVCVITLEGHLGGVKCLEVLTENILASGSADYTIKLWNLRYESCIMTFDGHSDWVNSIAKLNDEFIVSCSDDKLIKVWGSFTGQCLFTLEGHSDSVKCIKKVSDEKIISCSSDNTIKLWSLIYKNCIKTFSGHRYKVNCVKMISDDYFISCSDDDTIRCWNIESGECLKILKGITLLN
jgi:hypothetical protein